MDAPGSARPAPADATTDNPVFALGRKVKSALSTSQQPSIRVLRRSPSNRTSPAIPTSANNTEKDGPSVGGRSRAGFSFKSLFSPKEHSSNDASQEDDADTVDLLDVMDPEVATLSTLTNVQNSLFVPQLGKLVDRRPAYRISESPKDVHIVNKLKAALKRLAGSGASKEEPILSNCEYAVLPDGERLEGWTQAQKEELDDMVRHQLHSKRAKIHRSWKGFLQYVRRPFGLFITIYATLITLFGAAWVLFLIGWISIGSKKEYVVNIVDNVLVALFAIIGDGLAPFRAVDTYHMIYIAHYHRKTWKKREKMGLPDLVDHNDLPEQREEAIQPPQVDLESRIARRMPASLARRIAPRIPKNFTQKYFSSKQVETPAQEYSVLSEEQQAKLDFHERKFSKSHTFYKPHETETHFAFPLKLLIAIVVVLDCHSILQISLGACTWGIPYQHRPFALTTVILCFSITCNIMGGVLISIGDKRTRKQAVIERMLRQELTGEAIEEMRTCWLKEAEARGEVHASVREERERRREEEENEEIKREWKSVPALPKRLLGKGEDHRQPSLPQEARRSSTDMAGGSSTSLVSKTRPKGKNKGEKTLPPLQEDLGQSAHVAGGADEASKEGTGQKVMRMFRRADGDRS